MKFRPHTLERPHAQWTEFDMEEAKRIRKEDDLSVSDDD
jgi:hypothetical protein